MIVSKRPICCCNKNTHTDTQLLTHGQSICCFLNSDGVMPNSSTKRRWKLTLSMPHSLAMASIEYIGWLFISSMAFFLPPFLSASPEHESTRNMAKNAAIHLIIMHLLFNLLFIVEVICFTLAKIRIFFYTTKDCVKKNKENIISITTTKDYFY